MTEAEDRSIKISEELKKEMDRFPLIDWSEISATAIEEKILLLKKLDMIADKSQLTEEDAIQLGKKINKSDTTVINPSE